MCSYVQTELLVQKVFTEGCQQEGPDAERRHLLLQWDVLVIWSGGPILDQLLTELDKTINHTKGSIQRPNLTKPVSLTDLKKMHPVIVSDNQ